MARIRTALACNPLSRLHTLARGYDHVMGSPAGFDYVLRAGDVVIRHHGKAATVLRGARAAQFLIEVEQGDPQLLMARVTGNYRRGNERAAKRHPRNAG